jgi:hypothetical protein
MAMIRPNWINYMAMSGQFGIRRPPEIISKSKPLRVFCVSQAMTRDQHAITRSKQIGGDFCQRRAGITRPPQQPDITNS